MTGKQVRATWNIDEVTKELNSCFTHNSELDLLSVLKNNSFLFYELSLRKKSVQPIFHEVPFGNELICDFAWLNDNSDGPEWTLIEIEKPKLDLFKKSKEPTYLLNHAIEQIKSWRRYFDENPSEKRRIFGAVGRFRYILVAGNSKDWSKEKLAKWRIDHNKNSNIEIRSSDIFKRALKIFEEHPEELWSFAKNPTTRNPSKLKEYWRNYTYMEIWRQIIS